MLDTITALSTDPLLKPVVADIVAALVDVPASECADHLRAAQDAIYHGAWNLPRSAAEPLLHAIGSTVEDLLA